jgi:HEAT repeats
LIDGNLIVTMKKRFDLKLENDSTKSRSVVEAYRRVIVQEEFEESLALVHYRGGEEEFLLGVEYIYSDDFIDRIVGADILGQLGWLDQTYREESVDLLIPMLRDGEASVVHAVCCALGHRHHDKSLPYIVALADSAVGLVRLGVAQALLGFESDAAINTLIFLSKDPDIDVRNWSMFGLATQVETDTDVIRNALLAGASDSDFEVRGEAFVGLAARKDSRVVDLLINEWDSHSGVSILSLEAAAEIASPRLYSRLVNFVKTLDCEDDEAFALQLHKAMEACKPKLESIN